MAYIDALRGYAYRVHCRDGFRCVYCGLDGSQDFSLWLHLSWDHLVPKDDPRRDDERFIVTACRFCNEAHNRTSFPVEGKTPEEIVPMKREAILGRRAKYREFWEERVHPTASPEPGGEK
jgi:5-methylcytosine-specific restriction endonuclease McrA